MATKLNAVYDGKVFKPEGPLDLKANMRVRITIEETEIGKSKPKKRSFLQTALSLKISGPPDWSTRLEDYLYEERNTD